MIIRYSSDFIQNRTQLPGWLYLMFYFLNRLKLGKEKREKSPLLKKLSVRNGTSGVVMSSLQLRPNASRFRLEAVNLSSRLLPGAMTE